MNITLGIKHQSAAKPLSTLVYEEGSETIPLGSTQDIVETGNTLPSNVEGKDIVQKSKAFLKYKEKANKMFNGKFDYSKFQYLTAKTKSIIVCPNHGEFLQNMDKHTALNSKGCKKCWYKDRPKPIHLLGLRKIFSYSNFLEKAKNKFNNQYSYDESSYKGFSEKMIIYCNIHGNFKVTPNSFLNSKIGCPKCARLSSVKSMTKDYDNFLKHCQKIYKNTYTYSSSNILNYINRKSIISIVCKNHGEFKKKAQKHLAGQGCFKCKIEELVKKNILCGGYSELLFNNKPELKNKPATLYLLKINNFYKVGITLKCVDNRIKGLKSKAKSFNERIDIKLLTQQKDTLYNCFLKEQLILQENKEKRIFKKWSTELLKDIDIKLYF